MRLRNGYAAHERSVEIVCDMSLDGDKSRYRLKVGLGHNRITEMSLCDIDLLKGHSFYAHQRRDGRYVARSAKTGDYLHRLIMNPSTDQEVDHIDGDPLNNCRENLRLCSTRQNNLAKSKPVLLDGQRCVGVGRKKRGYGYRNRKGKIVGVFRDITDAAKARDGYMLAEYSNQQPNEVFHPYAFITWNWSCQSAVFEMNEWIYEQAHEANRLGEVIYRQFISRNYLPRNGEGFLSGSPSSASDSVLLEPVEPVDQPSYA